MSGTEEQAAAGGFGDSTREVMPDERVAQLHLLRHGAVRDLGARIARGRLDTGVSEAGARQHEALARALRPERGRIQRLFSSDLPRCRLLAETVGEALGLAPEVDGRLAEQSLGEWEGRAWDDLSRERPAEISAYWADYAGTRPPGGESLGDVDQRVQAFWREHREDLLDQRSVIVTHVGVLRCFVARLLDLPLTSALRLAPATGSHTELLWSSAGAVLQSFGERPTFGSSDSP